jgi:hypothetical protein
MYLFMVVATVAKRCLVAIMSFFPRTLQRLGCFDFSFAKVGEARALQVPRYYSFGKLAKAFRIFPLKSPRGGKIWYSTNFPWNSLHPSTTTSYLWKAT